MFKKVIVSPLGELTEDTRIVGDKVRYRIYYTNPELLLNKPVILDPFDIIITDRLDNGLSEISVFNNGHYDPTTRTITWTVNGRLPRRRTYVEFEAVVSVSKQVRNQAFLSRLGPRHGEIGLLGETNIVNITVNDPPKLGWIPFLKDSEPGEPPRVHMKDETTMGATVRFDISGVFAYEEKVDGVVYHHLSIPGWAGLTTVGKPELPILGELIEVPFNVQFSPEIVKAESTTIEGYMVYPTQPPHIDAPTAPQPFIVDSTAYLADVDYPHVLAVAADEDIAVIRGHRVAFVKVNPIQYNPVTRKVTAYTTVEVRLNFNHPAQLKGIDKRLASPAFEELMQALVLNYKDPQRFYTPKSEGGEEKTGCEYLIITHDDFYKENDPSNPIVKLANWKRCKGYQTKVVKVSAIPGGTTANAIKAYIQNAYNHWNPAPGYILLVGDSDKIEPCLGLVPDGQPQILTDLYYATVDGSDYFPDIFIGRLSVDSVQQAEDVVNKILTYEQNPPSPSTHPTFYTDIALVGMFSDEDQGQSPIDGREGRPWIANLESIRQYLLDQSYHVERIYATDSGFPIVPNAQVPVQFNDGVNLPNDLQYPTYPWNGGTADISTALNTGRFLVTYRGHGSQTGWGEPAFGNGDIAALAANDLTPVVLSITCQAGWFDNEKTGSTTESFAEVFLRQPRTGAVAILGMSRNSYTGWNDFLIFGSYKAMWPTFAPNPHWGGHPALPVFVPVRLLRMGQILNFGRMFMAKAYGPDDYRKVEFEMAHLFGDPEMPIWTQAPDDLKVSHPKGIGATGTQEFLVKVVNAADGQAVQNATVVLTRNNAIVQWQQTHTDGQAQFKLNTIGSGDLDITVTALSFRPYMGSIKVKSGGAVLNRLEPPDGPEGQTIHVGGQGFQLDEQVDLSFGEQFSTTGIADASGEFGQNLPTVDISVPVGFAHGLVNVLAHGQISDRYAVRVFQVRNKNPVDLWTYDQWDPTTWSLHPGDNPIWDSPDIQLYDKNGNPVASNSLLFGETYTVKVNVRNKTIFPAQQARVVFKWANFGVGGPWQDFDTQQVDISKNPPGVTIVETSYSPSNTGHLCIMAEIEHVEDNNLNNNQGQENLHVGDSNSPTEVCFLVWNLTDQPAPVHLEVRQLIQPGQEKEERLWATWVKHPDPQVLSPGKWAEACVIADPAVAEVKKGTQAEFAVTAFIDRKMIGGVNLILVKQ